MPANYVLLGQQTLSQSAASVTFSNIPQTGYTDLKLSMSMRTDAGSGGYQTYVRFNSDSGANYNWRNLLGTGSSALSQNTSGDTGMRITMSDSSGDTANTFGNSEIYIPNYLGSTQKSVSADGVSENNATAATADLAAGLWTGTSAITSITIFASGANLVAGSTFSLYGIAAVGTTPVIAPKATGGDIIVNDGTYWYHAFLSSGTFTPAQALTCNYLVVAGGGGGAGDVGGGGGAGGLRSTVTATGGGGSLESALGLTANTSYTVTIGAGGAGGVANTGSSGNNSVFASITSTGGGYGGRGNTAGATGGSGGGGSGRGQVTGFTGLGGAGTSNQGYGGGNGTGDSSVNGQNGGGGGGAGAAGTNGTIGNGGTGGAGVAISALATPTGTGVSNYYAGGGAGPVYTPPTNGSGGAGGGGSVGGAGTANTGGGGGGGIGGGTTGGAGGSGIVIVRYTIA